METELKREDGKRKYDPPRLATISLRPEEAVLGACKITGHSGTGGSDCQPIGLCPFQGS
jgi:hypothetical protein